jgi:hypothetical protein
MTLTDKVSSVLSQDPPKGEDSALNGLRVYPRRSDDLSEFEFDCRDWGLCSELLTASRVARTRSRQTTR